MRGYRLVQGRCNGEVVYEARTAAVCANGSINHHYSTEPPQDCDEGHHLLQLLYTQIDALMSSNRLRLNSLKTKFIWLGTRQQLAKLDMIALAADFPHFK